MSKTVETGKYDNLYKGQGFGENKRTERNGLKLMYLFDT